MTLGGWVKNYLYIPMGGNRYGEVKKMRNLFVSMMIIGLWHGAGWTFILWGALHGVYLMINHQWRRLKISTPLYLSRALTFLCVVVAWVLFRADSLGEGAKLLAVMTDWAGQASIPWRRLGSLLALGWVLMICPHPIQLLKKTRFPSYKWEVATIILLVVGVLYITADSPFLYFQF